MKGQTNQEKRPPYKKQFKHEVCTVIWKEWREHILHRGSIRNFGLLSTIILILSFGFLLPFQFGREWITSPQLLIYWAWVPLFLVINTIADSIAGERERRTLETLLSTCISVRAILFGKIGAAILYAFGSLLLILAFGVFTINLLFVRGEILLYPLSTTLIILLFSLSANTLVATTGVLVSLRAKTIRQAQQGLSIAVMLFLFTPLFGYQYLPLSIRERIFIWMSRMGWSEILLLFTLSLLVNIGILAFTDSQFRRGKIDLK